MPAARLQDPLPAAPDRAGRIPGRCRYQLVAADDDARVSFVSGHPAESLPNLVEQRKDRRPSDLATADSSPAKSDRRLGNSPEARVAATSRNRSARPIGSRTGDPDPVAGIPAETAACGFA